MASTDLSSSGVFRGGKCSFVVCHQVRNLVGTSNPTIGNLDAMNSRRILRQMSRNSSASKHRLRLRRPELDVISAECQHVLPFSRKFEIDPTGMDLLYISDGIFGELVHTPAIDSRSEHCRAMPHGFQLTRADRSLLKHRHSTHRPQNGRRKPLTSLHFVNHPIPIV